MALSKMILNINGVDRMLICDKEKDTLADVIRRLGLTGTKIGCNTGQCGACSVLVDGEVIRSCVKKMKNVTETNKIMTIEGIGSPTSLHALQQAFIAYGGVQCGFCSPGFIVSAKGLLDKNNNPTRQEIRDWFQKHRNACRCTGYKPIVDAVMAAAKVLRGEMPIEDLQYKVPADGKIYGTAYPRPAALAKVTGTCDYGDDIGMKMPEVLHLAVVLPGVSHANILSLDTSEAEAMPGVVKVITYKDVKGNNRINFPMMSPRAKCDGFDRWILAEKKILRCGDVIALVAARTKEEARAAAKKVKFELESLPEYMNVLDAVAEGALQIHPEHPNMFMEFPLRKGKDTRDVMKESAYIAEGSFYSQREPHLPIEPDTLQAYIDDQGILNVHCKSLGIYATLFLISQGIGYPMDKIRIIENPTGASFGYTASPFGPAIVAIAAMATGKACTLTLNYEEHQHVTGKRAPSYANTRIGCDKNGKLTGMDFDILFDKGAYTELGSGLPEGATRFMGMCYTIPNIRGLGRVSITNHNHSTAYRAAGAPQTFTSFEQVMDMLAEKAGMDPLEFRYANIYRDGDISNNGHKFSVYPMAALIDKMRPVYQEALARAKKENTPEKRRGVGVSCSAYNTCGGPEHAEVALELNPDGTVTNFNTAEDQGQGTDAHALVHTYEALRPLGLRHDQIRLVMNDTGLCPDTGLAAGSRTHYVTGRCTVDAANKLMDAMRKTDGTYRTYEEMVAEGIPTKYFGISDSTSTNFPLDPNTGMGDPSIEYMWGVFLAEVEVDVATGKTTVLKMHAVVDCGTIGNIQSFEGQAFGGMMHSIGFALSEDYDDVKKDINLVNSGFSYINTIPDAENYTVDYIESPRPSNPFGSSGCSEVFQAGSHVCVINAIYNACGARIHELPARPEKVKAELNAIAQGKTTAPKPYFLGSDMWETLDEMEKNPV